MSTSPNRLPAMFACLALVWPCTACVSSAPDETPAEDPPAEAAVTPDRSEAALAHAPRPWTEDFDQPALLMAQDIRVVGPVGLLEHVAVQQDPTNHSHDVRTTEDGLRLESIVKQIAAPQPIRGQLDGLSLAAVNSLVVLEGPFTTEVVVEATGDVYYRDIERGTESRSPRLRLVGSVGR